MEPKPEPFTYNQIISAQCPLCGQMTVLKASRDCAWKAAEVQQLIHQKQPCKQ